MLYIANNHILEPRAAHSYCAPVYVARCEVKLVATDVKREKKNFLCVLMVLACMYGE